MHKFGALALMALVGALLAAVVAFPARADAPSVTAELTKTLSWDTGYIGQYMITNRTNATLQGWTVEFDLPPGQSITSAWSANLTSSGAHQVLTPAAWTRSVAAQGSVQFGFEVSASASDGRTAGPVNCMINGQPCSGSVAPASSTTTTSTTNSGGSGGPNGAPASNNTASPLSASFAKSSDWGTGFVGEYSLHNAGSAPVNDWRLEFDLAPGQALTSVWNAQLTASGRHQVLTPVAWTRSIGSGATLKIGFQSTSSGTFSAPRNCLLNGAPCTASPASTPPPPTTPPPTTAPITTPATTTPTTTTNPGAGTGGGNSPSGATRPGFIPYVDMTLSSDSLAAMSAASGVKRFTLGFIVSGAPCQASWGGYYGLGDAVMAQRIADLRAAGGDAIVSFGGAVNQELARTCPSVDALAGQYQAVIDRYGIRDLDFDIEGADQADTASLNRRFQAIARVQASGLAVGQPVHVSLTLPVMPSGLTDLGLGVVRAAIANGVDVGTVNVMAMDYFDPSLAPFAGRLGDYAVQAAQAVQRQLGTLYPGRSDASLWRMVGVTPMLGINDNPAEVFTTADAAKLTAFARQQGFGRLSMWSVNRDRPCPQPTSTAQITCSGVSDPAWAFSQAFLQFGA